MKRVPKVIWVLVGLNGALLSMYALLFPPYTGFDEPQHVDMVLHVVRGETWPWPGPGELPLSRGVGASSNPVYFGPLGRHPFTNDPLPNRPRATIGELDRLPKPRVSNYPNQMVQHPPAYYGLAALVLKAWPGSVDDMPYDEIVGVLRLLSILLMTPLPLLVWAAVKLLAAPTTAVAAAAFSLGIPGLTRVGANVQNDDLLILATSALLIALARVVTGDLSRRTAVFVGLFTALALFTKGFALVLPVVVLAAYAVHRRAGLRPLTWALGVGGVLGAPWYVMNIVRFGTIQPEGLGPAADAAFRGPATPNVHHTLIGYLERAPDLLVRRFWGAIGTPDRPSLPLWLAWSLTIAVALLITLAIVARRGGRGRLSVLLMPFPLMLVIVVAGSLHWWRFNGGLPGVQGRYLYPGILGLLAVVAMGLTTLLRSRRALAPLLAIGTAFVLQAWALVVILRNYWVPGHDVVLGAKGIIHWSPWPPAVTALPFVAVVVLTPWALVLCARGAFARSAPVIHGDLLTSDA
ncbi:MAG: hypothetical protein JWL79_1605 [Frankiales bacterium]|nr:hypothetical protein [Frankiales bacterium]